jgi:hypothetical protein
MDLKNVLLSSRNYCCELRYNISRFDVVDCFELSGFVQLLTPYSRIKVKLQYCKTAFHCKQHGFHFWRDRRTPDTSLFCFKNEDKQMKTETKLPWLVRCPALKNNHLSLSVKIMECISKHNGTRHKRLCSWKICKCQRNFLRFYSTWSIKFWLEIFRCFFRGSAICVSSCLF